MKSRKRKFIPITIFDISEIKMNIGIEVLFILAVLPVVTQQQLKRGTPGSETDNIGKLMKLSHCDPDYPGYK